MTLRAQKCVIQNVYGFSVIFFVLEFIFGIGWTSYILQGRALYEGWGNMFKTIFKSGKYVEGGVLPIWKV